MTSKSSKKQNNLNNIDLVRALLDKLTNGNGGEVLKRISENPSEIDHISEEIALGESIEYIRKLRSTYTLDIELLLKADFEYVGLPSEASRCAFDIGFQKYIKERVGKRADGFAKIFSELDKHRNPTIVETGCLRVPNNWEGDGQSTFQFDWYAREHRGHVITIDSNKESIDSTRIACSSITSTILNDSVSSLNLLSSTIKSPVSLIYLDSFDLDLDNPMPSAIHHAMEVMAARNLIGAGSILCIDDFNVPPLGPGGKGLIVDRFMENINAEVIYSGYQKIWKI